MRAVPTPLAGVWVVESDPVTDARGHFVRLACRESFGRLGLPGVFDLTAASWNRSRGTLRGMHWQRAPHGEHKLVRAVRGALFDVALDLREGSPTFGRWHGVRLDARADTLRALLVPPGVAHGFQTLVDDTEVLYQIAGATVPEAACGVRWDDPAFGIVWPLPVSEIAPRDAAYPWVDCATEASR